MATSNTGKYCSYVRKRCRILSTEELKNYINNEIQTKLEGASCDYLFFSEGTDNSAEGTYMFNKNNEYHILYTEKGKIRSDIVTNDRREVLRNALEILSASIIMNFAISKREKGKDFQERKDKEISDILTKNPYNDV